MKRLSALALAAFLGLAPAIAIGLGLGDIRVNSALNQRLDAEIDLLSASDDELNALKVRLADAATFDKLGVERSPALSSFEFEVVKRQGGAFVRVTSSQPVREPFLTFIVEARWPRGRLLREYTVLLDPPVLADSGYAPQDSSALVARPVEAPLTATPVEAPAAEVRPNPQPELVATPVVETPAASAAVAPAEQPAGEATEVETGSYGPVRRNETLWAIASRLKPEDSITINQMMIALFRANPEAFRGNINHLKRGAILRIPDVAELHQLSVAEANAEAIRHNQEWQASRGAVAVAPSPEVAAQPAVEPVPEPAVAATPTPEPVAPTYSQPAPAVSTVPEGNLSIVAPTEGAAEPSTDPAARVAELEKQLADARAEGSNTKRKKERIARLEKELGEARAALTVTSDTLAQVQDQAAAPASVPAMAPSSVPSYAPTTMAAPATSPATVAAPATVASEPVVTAPAKPKKGMLDKLLENLFDPLVLGLLVGIPLLAAAVVVGLKRFKAKQAERRAALHADWPVVEQSDDDKTAVGSDFSAPAGAAPSEERTVIRGPDPNLLAATGETVAIPEENVEKTVMLHRDRDEMEKTIMQTMAVDTAPKAPPTMAAPAAPEQTSAATDTMVGGTPLKLDENDPISEADFHMAYGLYDQASDLIKKASQREPTRRDLRLKLLEIYFSAGNKTAFVTEAKTLRQMMGAAPDSDWANVAIFGKQIAPEEAMFSESGGASAATLDFDASGALGTQTSVDLAFDEPPAAAPSALSVPELPAAPAAAPAPKEDEPLEFNLGDFELDAKPAAAAPPAPKQGDHTDSQSDFDKALAELSSFVDTNIPKQGGGDAQPAAGGDELDLGSLELDDSALSIDGGDEAGSEIDTKLDLARAYIDMLDPGSAKGILEEVLADGDEKQKAEAEKLLKQIG